jgi:hypothetical protein
MNKKLVTFVMTILTVCSSSILLPNCYRGEDGYFRCNDGKKEVRITDSKDHYRRNNMDAYFESRRIPQNNPYDTSFYSDPTYPRQDGTNRNMGNR